MKDMNLFLLPYTIDFLSIVSCIRQMLQMDHPRELFHHLMYSLLLEEHLGHVDTLDISKIISKVS